MPRLNAQQQGIIRKLAESKGDDPDEIIREVSAALAEDDDQVGASDPAASDDDESDPSTVESGAKAHAGRGYFAYEFPFLTVNEVRASLFLPPVADGAEFTGEWLAKRAPVSSTPTAAPAAATNEGES